MSNPIATNDLLSLIVTKTYASWLIGFPEPEEAIESIQKYATRCLGPGPIYVIYPPRTQHVGPKGKRIWTSIPQFAYAALFERGPIPGDKGDVSALIVVWFDEQLVAINFEQFATIQWEQHAKNFVL